jgi:hypothetical protein
MVVGVCDSLRGEVYFVERLRAYELTNAIIEEAVKDKEKSRL